MNQNLLLHFFPVPGFLEMPAIGLDISDRSVKYVELKSNRSGFSLGRFGEQEIPAGVVEAGLIKKPAVLARLLASVGKSLGEIYVAAALPEEKAYLVDLSLPAMERRNLRGAIELALEEHVPLPPAEVVFDYEIVSGPAAAGFGAVVTVMPKNVVGDYLGVFNQAGFRVVAFEIEAQALARAVVPQGANPTAMIVDFGRTRTGFTVFSEESVWFTSTVGIGGDNIVKAVAEKLQVNEKIAREIKEKNGLSRATSNREIFNAITPVASILRDELEKHYLYWNTHPAESGVVRPKIEQIILSGGDANIPGLLEYLAPGFQVTFSFANPWVNLIESFDEVIPVIPLNHSLRYATALGLALRRLYQ